jgi:glutathione synthase/RimK-type ligase-like ATP-grasp enzyme
MTNFRKVFLHPTDVDEMEIQIGEELFQTFQLNNNQSLQLHCGSKSFTVKASPISGQPNTVHCSRILLKKLHLPEKDLPIRVMYESYSSSIYLGPIIALLTQINRNHHFQALTSFCEEIHKFCEKEHVFFYVFSAYGWQDEFVDGYIYENNDWRKLQLPIPQAVYNRIHSRTYEQSDKVQQLFRAFQSLNINYFNDHFLNKWEVYEKLSPHEYMIPFLPETRLMNGFYTLKEMLESYTTVFIKPVHGSQGREIYRIQLKDDVGYVIDYSSFQGGVAHTFDSIEELYQSLRERLKNQRFIIQQGLKLISYNSRPLDFRYLCVRDEHDHWNVISSVARVSGANQFVSNLAKGGKQYKVKQVLEGRFSGRDQIQIRKTMNEVVLEAASLVGTEMNGCYGELGIDLAVDEEGHPWILEINTKPSKNMEPDKDKPSIRPSAKAIARYCYQLALKQGT